jgi:hypothetical protein
MSYDTPSDTDSDEEFFVLSNSFGGSPQDDDDEWEDIDDNSAPATAGALTTFLSHYWYQIKDFPLDNKVFFGCIELLLLSLLFGLSIVFLASPGPVAQATAPAATVYSTIISTTSYPVTVSVETITITETITNVSIASAAPTITGSMTNAEEDIVSATLSLIHETPSTTSKLSPEATNPPQSMCSFVC